MSKRGILILPGASQLRRKLETGSYLFSHENGPSDTCFLARLLKGS
jgi:hypothetical protein